MGWNLNMNNFYNHLQRQSEGMSRIEFMDFISEQVTNDMGAIMINGFIFDRSEIEIDYKPNHFVIRLFDNTVNPRKQVKSFVIEYKDVKGK